MLILSLYRRDMPLMRYRLLLSGRTRFHSALAAVIADAIYCRVVDHRGVVNVVNVGDVHVVHRTVVEKVAIIPPTTLVALAEVAESVSDPTVETYVKTPVSFIKSVST